ncbi:6806_t:CDS:1, partial [Rhizophagus irregularis]
VQWMIDVIRSKTQSLLLPNGIEDLHKFLVSFFLSENHYGLSL